MNYTIAHSDEFIKITIPANGFGEPTVVTITPSLVRVDHDSDLTEVKSFPREREPKPALPFWKGRKIFKP